MLDFMVERRPKLAAELLRYGFRDRFEFSNALLERLMQSQGSRLYEELRSIENLTKQNGYFIDPRNTLLTAYVANATVASDLAAYKPVGDHVLRVHGPAMTPEYLDFMNGNASDFDNERWPDPTHAGIRFIVVMARAAVEQGVPSHMWINYIPHVSTLGRAAEPSRRW
ncbi:hypothetical protein GCM10007989_20960 [Devosia pacifica]|uniref:Uncharacterized protein n=1 Tax=Devosia pacifica TaxID=1335967 RepID=A0A918S7V1_9HYPH|nr:hypothetical protein [Devosia pacifica]GHA25092.1 hypothetical protein GCM10007989_20960 [Devosia pacifica]